MRSAHGFTLIELLVVISIIAILSVVGIVIFTGVQKSVRDAKRRADIDAIFKAFEQKYKSTGTYGDLTPANNNNLFASNSFPKDPRGMEYTIIADNQTNAEGFKVCAPLEDNPNQTCTGGDNCFCRVSIQGSPPDLFAFGNPVPSGSFERDSNGDGLADNWTNYGANSVFLTQSPAPVDGGYVQKVVVNLCCYSGIAQTITGLKPSISYKQTAWMYLESGHGPCTSVGVGMQGLGGETFVGCNRLDQWVQLTLTGNSDTLGNVTIRFQTWTANAFFYIDAVRLEEV